MGCIFDRTNRNALTVETRKLLLLPFRNKRPPPSRNGNEIGKKQITRMQLSLYKVYIKSHDE